MQPVITIGSLAFNQPFILAPLSGISDLPFRLINRSFGAPMAFTEMIDLRAISYRDRRTRAMLLTSPSDKPLGVQVLASDEDYVQRAIDVLVDYQFDLLDFNAACPAPKVTRKGKGAALLKEPRKLEYILRAIVGRAPVPITAKIRTGWDENNINAREVALRAEDSGIKALFVHGRTKTQGYSGQVDYRTISEVKKALRIPVIASGDNMDIPSIKKMFDETGCDGIAIARGSLGNPWIFKETIGHFCHGVVFEKPSLEERIGIIKQHLHLSVAHYGEPRGMGIYRKFFVWYTRGLKGAKPLRDRAFRCATLQQFLDVIDDMRALPLP